MYIIYYTEFYLAKGLVFLCLTSCLVPMMAAPAPTLDPITAASFTAAGGMQYIIYLKAYMVKYIYFII